MAQKLVIPLFTLAVVVLLWAVIFKPVPKNTWDDSPTNIQNTKRSVQRKIEPRRLIPKTKKKPVLNFDDDSQWTRLDVSKNGLIGRSERWISAIMDQPAWSPRPRKDAPHRFVNLNGVELIWATKNGRVIGASATFPENALSADLTALSEFFVGHNGHLPMHFESSKKIGVRYGDFPGPAGRRLYYRGRLRTTGTPPFGPEEFEIQLGSFADQPIQLVPQRNEHENPDL